MPGFLGAVVLIGFFSVAYNAAHTWKRQNALTNAEIQQPFLLGPEWSSGGDGDRTKKRPNIVFILTDDQDAQLGSMQYMANVQKSLVGHGISLDNHFVTVAQCCPSRATLFRGQAAHNTNNTHVMSPGGGWAKFVASGENENHLPHWLKQAGYTSSFMGKFLNEYFVSDYSPGPLGWDWTDILIDPYVYEFNDVVMSQNGERPLYYQGWHQADVIRIKALDRLKTLINDDKPFFLEIAPSIPHNRGQGEPTVPLARHKYDFADVKAPRLPNFNPKQKYQNGKSSWVRDMPVMNDKLQAISDESMRARVRGLQGVDEMVEDIVTLLEEHNLLDNTYIIYTSDNGFHLGSHRLPAGKGLPYIEDTKVPFVVRGPGISPQQMSKIPSTHIDFVPTILDIAGLPREDWPEFLDGRSLLQEWKDPDAVTADDGISREALSVEFWGSVNVPAGVWSVRHGRNSYKALRIISENHSWLFARWCTDNQTELYNTLRDPYELENLALNPTKRQKHIMTRLSALLLVTKSCGKESCRKPWRVLSDACGDCSFTNLEQALNHKYDSFFDSLPEWGFQTCLPVQDVRNEGPYFPPESISLGSEYRRDTSHYAYKLHNNTLVASLGAFGDLGQRHAGHAALMRSARPLTDAQIGHPVVRCGWPGYCRGLSPRAKSWMVEDSFDMWEEEITPLEMERMRSPPS